MKYLRLALLVVALFFLLKAYSIYPENNLKEHLNSEKSSFNYIIIDDLWDFINAPSKNILSYHSFFTWTVPTFILLGLDEKLTHFYINEIVPVVIKGREEGYIIQLNDHLIFSSLKFIHLLNSVILNNNQLYRFTYSASEAIVDSYFVAQSIKMITGRARPVLSDEGPNSWFHPTLDPFGKDTSFPSLHATYFFSVSTIIVKSIDNEILGDVIGFLSFFSFTGHNHWISDMWVGYLLGKSIGNYVWNKNRYVDFRDKWWVHLTFRPDFVSPHPTICVLKFF